MKLIVEIELWCLCHVIIWFWDCILDFPERVTINEWFWHKRKISNFDPYNVLMTGFVLQGHICYFLTHSSSIQYEVKVKVTMYGHIRPIMVTHTRNLCSAFNPSKVHTHSSKHTHTHTHTVNTNPEQWVAISAAAPGEQLGVRGIEGGESAVHSLPPPTIAAGPRLELAIFWLRVWLSNH